MDTKVKAGLVQSFRTFSDLEGADSSMALQKLLNIFSSDEDFMAKVASLDQIFDDQPNLDALREITFDLLMINFFSEDTKKLEEDYLDSPDWEKIEEDTIDRGTELLNLLLYLKECEDEDIEPALDDYLKEFLLVEEDEFQDEHRIYEDVIANQMLMESSLKEISRVSKKIDPESEMRELFYPVMAFFFETKPDALFKKEFKALSEDPAFDTAILDLLIAYNQSKS